jgi:hypothetical protein
MRSRRSACRGRRTPVRSSPTRQREYATTSRMEAAAEGRGRRLRASRSSTCRMSPSPGMLYARFSSARAPKLPPRTLPRSGPPLRSSRRNPRSPLLQRPKQPWLRDRSARPRPRRPPLRPRIQLRAALCPSPGRERGLLLPPHRRPQPSRANYPRDLSSPDHRPTWPLRLFQRDRSSPHQQPLLSRPRLRRLQSPSRQSPLLHKRQSLRPLLQHRRLRRPPSLPLPPKRTRHTGRRRLP